MDDYDIIKKSSLKFKGDDKKKKKKKTKKDDKSSENSPEQNSRFEDAQDHGGWWRVDKYDQIKEEVAIEFVPGCYAKAMSNGSIVLGNPHPPGEEPEEEEIFTVVPASTGQIALKSGFGRYLGLDSNNRLMGLSEAIGALEMLMPVFEDSRIAICASNGNFLSPEQGDEPRMIVARAEKAEVDQFVEIRVSSKPR